MLEVEAVIGFDRLHVAAGDSLAFDPTAPHLYRNPTDAPARSRSVVVHDAAPEIADPRASELDTAGKRTIGYQVGSGDEACSRTTEEYNGIGDLPRFRHPAGWVESERGGE